MYRLLTSRYWLVFLWALLTFTSLIIHPLLPVDETRYVSVAWEMWVRNDFLVPHLNGEAYSHKPPLLFWLMQLSWWLFGINDWSPRLISPLFALATLFLSKTVAKLLWPKQDLIAEATTFFLLGGSIWTVFSTLTMFDIMLTFFALLGIYSLLKQVRGRWSYQGNLLFGLAIGGGILSKGPVILLHVLPVAILAPWWLKSGSMQFSWRQWYAGIALSVIVGAAIALCWALPAGVAGGQAYRDAIFLGQTSGRIVDSFAHKLPWWWYLQLLPLFLMPWLLTKPFWVGLAKLDLKDLGVRFCIAWLLPVFVAFTGVSGKRIHYLIPLLPGIAMLLAFVTVQLTNINWRKAILFYFAFLVTLGVALVLLPSLSNHFHGANELSMVSPAWGGIVCVMALTFGWLPKRNILESLSLVATSSVICTLVLASGFFSVMWPRYDIKPPAQKIAELRTQNKSVAMYADKYHGQFQFAGRLVQPIPLVSGEQNLLPHARQFPHEFIVVIYKGLTSEQETLFAYSYPFRNQKIGFITGKKLSENPHLAAFFFR